MNEQAKDFPSLIAQLRNKVGQCEADENWRDAGVYRRLIEEIEAILAVTTTPESNRNDRQIRNRGRGPDR